MGQCVEVPGGYQISFFKQLGMIFEPVLNPLTLVKIR